jgi:AcrR family transcriptional regulator
VATSSRVREEQRAASESAILGAAWDLFARSGPDGASLRDVGAAAGCTHTLVVRYFGSKVDLEGAVACELAARVDRAVGHAVSTAADPLGELLGAARTHRSCAQLLVRSALGDLPPRGLPACLHLDRLLAPSTDPPRPALAVGAPGLDRRSRLCSYAAASLVLGFVSFEGFLVAATGLGSLAPRRRDAAIAGAARQLVDLADGPEPRLAPRDLAPARPLTPTADPAPTAPDALLESAIELFAERGPASVSVRDIARHAGVNQGLIYRHFGSKDALLADALERGSSGLFPAALTDEGFDFDAMSWLVHHASPAPRLIARTLVDDVDISSVRRRFPILRRLLDAYDDVPTGAGPGDLTDPRLAVVATAGMALGSAIWGELLCHALGLGEREGIESAIADLAQLLVMAPAVAGRDRTDR